nr:acetyl-CoA carboxylase [Tanacetum cinerariifolium]
MDGSLKGGSCRSFFGFEAKISCYRCYTHFYIHHSSVETYNEMLRRHNCYSEGLGSWEVPKTHIIEEGPITVAPQETIKKLERAARKLAKSVNFVGAATVDYLYSMETGDHYFLELNPRLQ